MVTVLTERDAMINMQRTDIKVLYIVGVNMRTSAVAGLARLGLLAIIIAICSQIYKSLFAARPSSIKVTRYSTAVNLVQRKEKNYC